MRDIVAILLASLGVAQFIYFGYNIFTIMLLILLCFIAGLIGSLGPSRSQMDSDNLSNIAQIERNRYFRKWE